MEVVYSIKKRLYDLWKKLRCLMKRKGIKSVLKTAKLRNFEVMMTGNKKTKYVKSLGASSRSSKVSLQAERFPQGPISLSCSIFLQITSKHFTLNSTGISMEVNPLQTLSHHGMIITIDILCTLIMIDVLLEQKVSIQILIVWSVDS